MALRLRLISFLRNERSDELKYIASFQTPLVLSTNAIGH